MNQGGEKNENQPRTIEAGPKEVLLRIYVASLADYNAGELHGAWIDAAQEVEELHEHVQRMLDDSRQPIAEEWA